MARNLIKRLLPSPEWIKSHPSLQILGDWVHDPNLWHLTRHSVATAAFIGLFIAFMPLPTQMLLAGFMAFLFHANLPISVLLVWVSNPLTMPPLFYMAYQVGAVFIPSSTPADFSFELSWHWLSTGLVAIWQPFLLGCVMCGLFFGLLASTSVRLLWRWYVIKRWHERRLKRHS